MEAANQIVEKWRSWKGQSCAHFVADVLREDYGITVNLPDSADRGQAITHKAVKKQLKRVARRRVALGDARGGDIIIVVRGRAYHAGIIAKIADFPYVLHYDKEIGVCCHPYHRFLGFYGDGNSWVITPKDGESFDYPAKAFAAGASILASILTSVAVGVGLLFLGRLFAPTLPQFGGTQGGRSSSPNYTFSGAENSARPDEPMQLVMGTVRQTPDWGTQPYTIYQADDEAYFNALLHFGIGTIGVSDVKIGDTPVAEYSDVSLINTTGSPLTAQIGDPSLFGFNRRLSRTYGSVDVFNRRQSHSTVSSDALVNSMEVTITNGNILSVTATDAAGVTTPVQLPDTYTETSTTQSASRTTPGYTRGGGDNSEYIPPRTTTRTYTYLTSGGVPQTFTITLAEPSIITMRLRGQAEIIFRLTGTNRNDVIETNVRVEEGAELAKKSGEDATPINRTVNSNNANSIAANFAGQLYHINSSGNRVSNSATIKASLINPNVPDNTPSIVGGNVVVTAPELSPFTNSPPENQITFTWSGNRQSIYRFEYNGAFTESPFQIRVGKEHGGILAFQDFDLPENFSFTINGVRIWARRTDRVGFHGREWDLGELVSGDLVKRTPAALAAMDTEIWDFINSGRLPESITLNFDGSGITFAKYGTEVPLANYISAEPTRVDFLSDGQVRFTNSGDSNMQITLRTDRELPFFARTNPQVRFSRVTDNSTSSQYRDRIRVQQIIVFRDSQADHTAQNRAALAIRASETANGTVNKITGLTTWTPPHTLPLMSGSTHTEYRKDNPAVVFYNLVRGLRHPDTNELIYGLGYPDEWIDVEYLQEWAEFCERYNYTFNAVLDTTLTADDALAMITDGGQGFRTWRTGRIGVIPDYPAQVAVATLTEDDTLSFKYTANSADRFSSIPVKFANAEQNYEVEEFSHDIEGVPDTAEPSRQLELIGVTSRSEAERRARLLATKFDRVARVDIKVTQRYWFLGKGDTFILYDYSMRRQKLATDGNFINTNKVYLKIVATETNADFTKKLTCVIDEDDYGGDTVYPGVSTALAANRVWTADDTAPPLVV